MKNTKRIGAMIFLSTLAACSGGGSSVGGTETGNTIGAAVASIFNTQEQQAGLKVKSSLTDQLAALLIREARAQTAGLANSACQLPTQTTSDITISPSVTPGTYGASGNPSHSVTLTSADGCDQGGSYASFKITSHNLTCTSSQGTEATTTMKNSTGVFRITEPTTQIYGNFTVTTDGETANQIGCHFAITFESGNTQSQFATAFCVDSGGNSVSQATDTMCSDKK